MPRRNPDEAVLGAVVGALLASTGVTGLVSTRVYNNVPQNSTFPLVRVTLPTTRRIDAFGRYGQEGMVDVDIVSQAFGDLESTRILDQCVQTLDFTRPSVSGHTSLGLNYDATDRFAEMVNGIQTRHTVASFRYWTEQSSS